MRLKLVVAFMACQILVVEAVPAFAQQVLKVATFNVYRPGLVSATPSSRSAILTHFGKDLLSQSDVALVQEVGDNAWTEVLSGTSGLPYFTTEVIPDQYQADVAILSRFPLSNVVMHPGPVNGYWLEAQMTIGGRPHRFVTSHFPLKGGSSGDASQARQSILQSITNVVNGYPGEVFFGGDFNATDDDASIAIAFSLGWDSIRKAPADHNCGWVTVPDNGQRIDYIMLHGHYDVTAYTSCQDSRPSDHNMVLATYLYDAAAVPAPPGPIATPCRDQCLAVEQSCMSSAHTGPARAACGRQAQECELGCNGH